MGGFGVHLVSYGSGAGQKDYTGYVNLFICTEEHEYAFPGVVVPVTSTSTSQTVFPTMKIAGECLLGMCSILLSFIPIVPGPGLYLATPVFGSITHRIDSLYYQKEELVFCESSADFGYIDDVKLEGKKHDGCRVAHYKLENAEDVVFEMTTIKTKR